MLRTIFGIILLSIFVTPVFAAPNKLLPKMYAQKDIPDIIKNGEIEVKKGKDGKISYLLIPGEGISTQNAICDVVRRYSEYLLSEQKELWGTIHRRSGTVFPGGGVISSFSTLNEATSESTMKDKVEFKINKKYLRCTSTTKTIDDVYIVKNTIESNTILDSSSMPVTVDISDLQSDKIKVLEYGIRQNESDVWVILVIGIKF